MKETFSTSQIARLAGVHPNTIRLYEQWKFLSPVPRLANGYRRFSPVHLAQVQVVRASHHFTWIMGDVRRAGLAMMACSSAEDWEGVCQMAERIQEMVRIEHRQATAAVAYLELWVQQKKGQASASGAPGSPLQTTQAARLLDTTIDCLRNWERNGLLCVPRDPNNGYRRYGPAEIGRLRVIRVLIRSRYSIMAILRMLTVLDQGQQENLGQVLDTPRPGEDVFYATDHWLTTLNDLEKRAEETLLLVNEIRGRFRS